MPATALKVVQLFAEPASTWGSTARATVKLIGVTDAQASLDQDVYQPPSLGWLYPANQTVEVAQSASGSIKQDGLYQDICYLLDGVFGPATASAGAGTAQVRNYAAPIGATSKPRSYTIEFGTTAGPIKMLGAIPASITIEGEAGKVWTVACDLIGQKMATLTALSTAATNTRPVNLIRVADTVFAVGAWANSTYTNVAATLISFSLAADPKRHAKTYAGSVNPSSHGEDRWEGSLTTVLEFNSTAAAYVTAMLSGAVQRRIKLTATNTTPSRIAAVEFAGTLVDGVKLFEDRDGNITVSLKWNGTYSSTLGNWLKAKITNELATLR